MEKVKTEVSRLLKEKGVNIPSFLCLLFECLYKVIFTIRSQNKKNFYIWTEKHGK